MKAAAIGAFVSALVLAIVLGLGRAIGEAIAVTQVIGAGWTIHLGLFGPGDDYELLFCVADRDRKWVPKVFRGVALTEIGRVTKQRAMKLVESSGKIAPLRPLGWDPF